MIDGAPFESSKWPASLADSREKKKRAARNSKRSSATNDNNGKRIWKKKNQSHFHWFRVRALIPHILSSLILILIFSSFYTVCIWNRDVIPNFIKLCVILNRIFFDFSHFSSEWIALLLYRVFVLFFFCFAQSDRVLPNSIAFQSLTA